MDCINNFGEYLTDKGKAKKTVESYTGDLRGYFSFLTDRDITFEGILNSVQSFNDFLSHHVKVVGKGGKYPEIPLKPELVDTIKKYIVERRHNPYYKSEYLLLGQRGSLGRDAINRILARITKEAKLPQKLKPMPFHIPSVQNSSVKAYNLQPYQS